MRLLVVASLLLAAAALPGCVQGTFGICTGNETPRMIISDEACTKWIIEIDHVSGMAPEGSALSLLETRMDSLVRKDDITLANGGQTNLQGDTSWTDSELRSLHRSTQDFHTGDGTVVTHLLYVDGEYSANNGVVGVAYGSEFVVMFKDTIRSATSGFLTTTTAAEMERAVLVHEFGHILGLVDGGTEMQNDHHDDEHPGHSSNPNSVMYWAVETTQGLEALFQDSAPPTEFDANDKRDIACAGGKGTC